MKHGSDGVSLPYTNISEQSVTSTWVNNRWKDYCQCIQIVFRSIQECSEANWLLCVVDVVSEQTTGVNLLIQFALEQEATRLVRPAEVNY